MMGEPPPVPAKLIPPVGVITRQSTDVLAIADRYVAQALSIIRRHACSGIDVQSLLAQLPLSRRSLEQRFRRVLGRSPGAEIQRFRIEQAKILLADTDLTVEVISRRTGFNKSAYFSTAFRNRTGARHRRCTAVWRARVDHLPPWKAPSSFLHFDKQEHIRLFDRGQGPGHRITLLEQVAGVRGDGLPAIETTGGPADFDGLNRG